MQRTKASPENNFTVELNWHIKAKELPKKSGKYCVLHSDGRIGTVDYSNLNKLFNSYDSIERDTDDYYDRGVIAWANLPFKTQLAKLKDYRPVPEYRHERFFACNTMSSCIQMLWYNPFFNIFNSLEGDLLEDANKWGIKYKFWCRIAKPHKLLSELATWEHCPLDQDTQEEYLTGYYTSD